MCHSACSIPQTISAARGKGRLVMEVEVERESFGQSPEQARQPQESEGCAHWANRANSQTQSRIWLWVVTACALVLALPVCLLFAFGFLLPLFCSVPHVRFFPPPYSRS